jgi:hypothetical protein
MLARVTRSRVRAPPLEPAPPEVVEVPPAGEGLALRVEETSAAMVGKKPARALPRSATAWSYLAAASSTFWLDTCTWRSSSSRSGSP